MSPRGSPNEDQFDQQGVHPVDGLPQGADESIPVLVSIRRQAMSASTVFRIEADQSAIPTGQRVGLVMEARPISDAAAPSCPLSGG